MVEKSSILRNFSHPTLLHRAKGKWRFISFFVGLAMAWFALHDAPWGDVATLFVELGFLPIIAIILINIVMLLLMTARWWLLLHTLGSQIPLLSASLYRNCANTISYITPGPHFGGEPFLVYLLRKRHGMELPAAGTSVIVDRLLELVASIIFLALGLLYLFLTKENFLADFKGIVLLSIVFILLLSFLIVLFRGYRPLSRLYSLFLKLARRHPVDQGAGKNGLSIIVEGELAAESLFRHNRFSFILANLLSIAHWLGIFIEFWLMAYFLGFPLSTGQVVAIVLVARLAFFTPLPAGIGVLETALPYISQVLGLGPALGIGLCLIIRFRDIIFCLIGVFQTMKYLTCGPKTIIVNDK